MPDLGFPAHAGMDPRETPPSSGIRRFPRTRGDGPPPSTRTARGRGVSPHTRGWTPAHRRHPPGRPGFPAHAGMDPRRRQRPVSPRWFPRTRGDGPLAFTTTQTGAGVSPHTRGWTPHRPRGAARSPGFPRTRGDGPDCSGWGQSRLEVSPHTRGWTRRRRRDRGEPRGFPAHAGMDPGRGLPMRPSPGFPRTRGDGPLTVRVKRGTTVVVTDHGRQVARIIPETDSAEQKLAALKASGTLVWSGRQLKKRKPSVQVQDGGTVSDIVDLRFHAAAATCLTPPRCP